MRIRDRSLNIILGNIIVQACSIGSVVILVRLLSQRTFGTYQQVLMVYGLLSGTISLQLETSLYYFVPKLGLEERRNLLYQTFLFGTAMACVISGAMFFGADFIAQLTGNAEIAPLLRIFCLFPFLDRIVSLVPSFMISVDRGVRAGIYTSVMSVSRFIVVVGLSSMGVSLPYVFWGFLIASCMVCIAGVIDMLRFAPASTFRVDLGLLREQISFVMPLLVTAMVGTLSVQFDKVLISIFFPPEMYAIYACGAIHALIAVFAASLGAAMMPNLVQYFSRGDKLAALSIWQESARKCSLVLFPCFVFLLLAGRDVVIFLFTEKYALASVPFRVYVCSFPLKIIIFGSIFRAIGQTKTIAYNAVVALVINAVVGATIVILWKGSIYAFAGPAIGALVSAIGTTIFMMRNLSKLISVDVSALLRWKELRKIMLIALMSGLAFVFPIHFHPLGLKLIVQGSFYVACFLILLFITKTIKDDEKDLLLLPFKFLRTARR